jgi:predicted nuclease of predicted toxin-antitoxin system
MRVLLDECVDWRLSRDLTGHHVMTARQMGWTAIENGELLALAAQEFDVFVTVDRNLAFQQNLTGLKIAVLVLRAATNRLADLRRLVPRLLDAIASADPGEARMIGPT